MGGAADEEVREERGSTEQEVGTLAPWGEASRSVRGWLAESTVSRHPGTAVTAEGGGLGGVKTSAENVEVL